MVKNPAGEEEVDGFSQVKVGGDLIKDFIRYFGNGGFAFGLGVGSIFQGPHNEAYRARGGSRDSGWMSTRSRQIFPRGDGSLNTCIIGHGSERASSIRKVCGGVNFSLTFRSQRGLWSEELSDKLLRVCVW
jgi:hypothetical protein